MQKGENSNYRPKAGTRCQISPPNCDDENGYRFFDFDILWTDNDFVVYRATGCWPVVDKWNHIIAKPL